MSTVLITGGTGYVATYCIIAALEKGYSVRTTIRNLSKSSVVKNSVLKTSKKLKKEDIHSRLTFFAADLTSDNGWEEAIKGSDYILHVASPLPSTAPKDENEVIIPAKEGTLRVLKVANKVGGVKKLVLTSSFGAVGFGLPSGSKVDESCWSNINNFKDPYFRSKTIAEKAAWDYVKKYTPDYAFTVLNPAAILGPLVEESTTDTATLDLVKLLVSGETKQGCPKLGLGVVDVRDVAKLEVEALTNPESDGKRFILVSNDREVRLLHVANLIRKNLGPEDTNLKNLPTRELPSFLVKFASMFVAELRNVVPFLEKNLEMDNSRALRVFDWTPISAEEAVMASYNGLKKKNLI